MKKIITSLSIIAAVAAVVIGGTAAYFSDTETSTGNTFTAGILDLIVDIDGQIVEPLSGPIFSYRDIKPGDEGEKTLSLHVDNDACGFVSFDLKDDLENSCTDPEKDANAEPNCAVPGNGGELNDAMNWVVWLDQGLTPEWQGKWDPEQQTGDPGEGDNFQNYDEPTLTDGTLTGDRNWGFGGLEAGKTLYYGFKWNLPAGVGNEAQSDSFTADMIIRAEQYRNQFGPANSFPQYCPYGELKS